MNPFNEKASNEKMKRNMWAKSNLIIFLPLKCFF